MLCTFISPCYECLCAGSCRCQMCSQSPPVYARVPSLWFLQGHGVSIRASGLQEPKHSSLSVLPREAQPCLAFLLHLWLGGASGEGRGQISVDPHPVLLVSLEDVFTNTVDPARVDALDHNEIFSDRLGWCNMSTIRNKS